MALNDSQRQSKRAWERLGSRADGAPRAAELTAVALELFAQKSFSAVSIKSIGEAAGANSALIYYYFKDKEDLFRACIESAVEQSFEHFIALSKNRDDPAGTISGWLNTHVELYLTLRKMVKVSLDYKSSSAVLPSVEKSYQRFYAQEAEVLEACVREGVARGLFTHADPQAICELTSTFLDGAMVRSIILPEFDVETAVGHFREFLWRALGYEPAK